MADLPPGPELDALVAEKVMGWEKWGDDWYLSASGEDRFTSGHKSGSPNFCPSTDIRAAMEVVERVRGWGYADPDPDIGENCWVPTWELRTCCCASDCDESTAIIWWEMAEPERFVRAAGRGLPHAICLAALKAVEEAIT